MEKSTNKIRVFKDRNDWESYKRIVIGENHEIGRLVESMVSFSIRELRTDEWHITYERKEGAKAIVVEDLREKKE
jgi:hypothetical protein